MGPRASIPGGRGEGSGARPRRGGRGAGRGGQGRGCRQRRGTSVLFLRFSVPQLRPRGGRNAAGCGQDRGASRRKRPLGVEANAASLAQKARWRRAAVNGTPTDPARPRITPRTPAAPGPALPASTPAGSGQEPAGRGPRDPPRAAAPVPPPSRTYRCSASRGSARGAPLPGEGDGRRRPAPSRLYKGARTPRPAAARRGGATGGDGGGGGDWPRRAVTCARGA